ncbi:hypothetical protein VDG05_08740 [Xanthomonas campestris pv. raphani]|uniref:hypothetical protein n=1 Tax=Xanthomonas campestris TaxID=339 RepID=UPI002B225589|nr:hypothetical protein [Xanthomonas campestris]MEA9884429.1 hypothetical protein [Xanthomonas campestris pv. raphani]
MSSALPADPGTAGGVPLLALQPPPLRGWARAQAWLVDRIKAAALRQLHASVAGECLLLQMYLVGEEATELALQREVPVQRPAWLVPLMDQHLQEEQWHAQAFAAALAARGAARPSAQPDALSRRKIAQWHRLATHHAGEFRQGLLVPAFAIGLCAEQMASRVLQRHCGVLPAGHALQPLLTRVLGDEQRHVQQCQRILQRLVPADEQAALQALLAKVRRIDRAFGISGAFGMYAAGAVLRVRAYLWR